MGTWRLPASDLTFGWDDCRRCFYLKHVLDVKKPRSIMPKAFTTIDSLMKQFYEGRRTEDVHPELPPGVIKFGDKWLGSMPLAIRDSTVQLTGKFDCVVAFDDGTFGVIDYKTSSVKDPHVEFYSRQLHAYALCLEQPAPGKFGLGTVSALGLIVVEHRKLIRSDAKLSFEMDYGWIPCTRDDVSFMAFLDDVVGVLESPVPPEASAQCGYCSYRDAARRLTA